jgi:prepilin-type N-terminal cleavage/methylation domain-containing protein
MTGRRAAASRHGSTLVEVMVSMVILAIGLLALEALAVNAVRMTARADHESRYVTVAADQMETVLETIRRGENPGGGDRISRDDGATVETAVTRDLVGADQAVYTVQVTVTPPPGRNWRPAPVTVVGRAFQPL